MSITLKQFFADRALTGAVKQTELLQELGSAIANDSLTMAQMLLAVDVTNAHFSKLTTTIQSVSHDPKVTIHGNSSYVDVQVIKNHYGVITEINTTIGKHGEAAIFAMESLRAMHHKAVAVGNMVTVQEIPFLEELFMVIDTACTVVKQKHVLLEIEVGLLTRATLMSPGMFDAIFHRKPNFN